jgi:hypothetical protein
MYTKILVNQNLSLFCVYDTQHRAGADPKRRIDSRPASVTSIHATVPGYTQSPSMEHEFNHQRLHTHQEAMERFAVCF